MNAHDRQRLVQEAKRWALRRLGDTGLSVEDRARIVRVHNEFASLVLDGIHHDPHIYLLDAFQIGAEAFETRR